MANLIQPLSNASCSPVQPARIGQLFDIPSPGIQVVASPTFSAAPCDLYPRNQQCARPSWWCATRCSRPAYCCSVPFHDTGMASTRVSSGGWSKPSPTSFSVASKMRGASGGGDSISVMTVARSFFDTLPCSTKGVGTLSVKPAKMASKCSVRSVNTSTLRP